jgi:ribosomal protein S17
MKIKVVNIIDSKTFKGISVTYKKHDRYHKYITSSKGYLVDYSGLDVKIGDEFEIVQSRPVSKLKKWTIKK